ncbi:MAG: PIN domain-containing protein [Devosia sp.]
MAQLIGEFTGAIISVDINVALATARLQRIRTAPFNDAIIAATALVHDLVVVTRNERDFSGLGVKIVNPWSAP